MPYNQLPKS